MDLLRTHEKGSVYTAFPIKPVLFRNPQMVFQILIDTPGKYCITLSQPDQRNINIQELSYCSIILIEPPENYNPDDHQ